LFFSAKFVFKKSCVTFYHHFNLFNMITISNDIAINPSYITDELGKKLSVVLPISEFEALLKILFRPTESVEKAEPTPKKSGAARFRGVLTHEEADQLHTYVQKSREEWERNT
jgi:hypothetical protein